MKKLSTILLLVIVFLSCFAACGKVEQGAIKEYGDPVSSGKEVEEESASSSLEKLEEKSHAYDRPIIFHDENEFVEAVNSLHNSPPNAISNENTPNEGDYEDIARTNVIKDLNCYYVPKAIPENVSLEYMALKDFYIAIYYSINDSPDAELYYVFEWWRPLAAGDLENNMNRMYSSDALELQDKYYIVKSGALQDIFWEQDGTVFHAVTPENISDEEIAAFCNAEKVTIK